MDFGQDLSSHSIKDRPRGNNDRLVNQTDHYPPIIMLILSTEYQFPTFREQLYNPFGHRVESAMDLLDALYSNDHAPSVAKLSLNPLFKRDYTSLFKVIGESLALLCFFLLRFLLSKLLFSLLTHLWNVGFKTIATID